MAARDAVHKIADAKQRRRGAAIRVDVPSIQTADNAVAIILQCGDKYAFIKAVHQMLRQSAFIHRITHRQNHV
jgi:hypothetical protein